MKQRLKFPAGHQARLLEDAGVLLNLPLQASKDEEERLHIGRVDIWVRATGDALWSQESCKRALS